MTCMGTRSVCRTDWKRVEKPVKPPPATVGTGDVYSREYSAIAVRTNCARAKPERGLKLLRT